MRLEWEAKTKADAEAARRWLSAVLAKPASKDEVGDDREEHDWG